MTDQPRVQERSAQPYVALPLTVTMEGSFGTEVESGFRDVFEWLEQNGIEPAGSPFIRYLVIDMDGAIEIELAVPVAEGVSGDESVRFDVLPSGRYVTLLQVGPYDQLVSANAALQTWSEDQGIVFDSWETEEGSAWRGRVEHYLTGPSDEPDSAKWKTELAYLAREA